MSQGDVGGSESDLYPHSFLDGLRDVLKVLKNPKVAMQMLSLLVVVLLAQYQAEPVPSLATGAALFVGPTILTRAIYRRRRDLAR